MGLLDLLNKEKREAKKAEKARLAREFMGDYIITLTRRVDVVDAEIPFYYYGKEMFLCKTAGSPQNGVKQLTGEGHGRIFLDVNAIQEGDKTYYTAGEFFGEVNFDVFANRLLTVEEMESMARAYNSKAKYHALHEYEDYRKPQLDVDSEFVEDEVEDVEDDVEITEGESEGTTTTEVINEDEQEEVTETTAEFVITETQECVPNQDIIQDEEDHLSKI